MAYQGGGLLQIWKPDLTTRVGAQAAMDSAKFGFLILAGFRFLVFAFAAFLARADLAAVPEAAAALAGVALFQVALPLLAAWRLHLYKGAFAVPIATGLYVLGILADLTLLSIVFGIIFTGVFVGGIRGAWALRSGRAFEDDFQATFG